MTAYLFPAMTAFLLLLIGGLLWAIPRLTNPTVFFSVTVPPDFRDSEEGIAMTSRFRRQIAALTGALLFLILLVSLILAGRSSSVHAIAGIVLLYVVLGGQLLGAVIFFQQARHRILPHAVPPSTVREAVLRPPHAGIRKVLNLLMTVPFLIVAGCALYLRRHWAEIPARFPTHWGLDGKPNHWADKTPGTVFAPLAIAAVIAAVMIGIGLLIRFTPRTHVSGPLGAREERIRLTGETLLIGLAVFQVLLLMMFGVWTPLHGNLPPAFLFGGLAIIFIFIGVVSVVFVMVSRVEGGAVQAIGDRTDDRYWKWGLVYFNPGDPKVIVEKRFGIGWTFNFGRPAAWAILAALLIGLPLVIFMIGKLAKGH